MGGGVTAAPGAAAASTLGMRPGGTGRSAAGAAAAATAATAPQATAFRRSRPKSVAQRDAWLSELRIIEDRESLRPYITCSPTAPIRLEGLKDLARRLRLHKTHPSFWREHNTEEGLIRVLKKHVKPSHALDKIGNYRLSSGADEDRDRGGDEAALFSKTKGAGLPEKEGNVGSEGNEGGIRQGPDTGGGEGGGLQPRQPRPPAQPRRSCSSGRVSMPAKHGLVGGGSIFGQRDLLMGAMLAMSRLGASSDYSNCADLGNGSEDQEDLRNFTNSVLSECRLAAVSSVRDLWESGYGYRALGTRRVRGGASDIQDFDDQSCISGATMSVLGKGRLNKRSGSMASVMSMESMMSRATHQGGAGAGLKQGMSEFVMDMPQSIEEDDYEVLMKVKAAEALLRLSKGEGSTPSILADGGVEAIRKLTYGGHVKINRVVAACIANLTSETASIDEVLNKGTFSILSAITTATNDESLLCSSGLALCRCTYTAAHQDKLLANSGVQALCYIGQQSSPKLKVLAIKGLVNFCLLSAQNSSFVVSAEGYLSSLSTCLSDLSPGEDERASLQPLDRSLQDFVCDVLHIICGIHMFAIRAIDMGVLDILHRMAVQVVKPSTGGGGSRARENALKIASSLDKMSNLRKIQHQMARSGYPEKIGRILLQSHPSNTLDFLARAAVRISYTKSAAPLLKQLAVEILACSEKMAASNTEVPDCTTALAVLVQNVLHPEFIKKWVELQREGNGAHNSSKALIATTTDADSKDGDSKTIIASKKKYPMLQWLVRCCCEKQGACEEQGGRFDDADELSQRRVCILLAIYFAVHNRDYTDEILDAGLIQNLGICLRTTEGTPIAEAAGNIVFALAQGGVGVERGVRSGIQLIRSGLVDLCSAIVARFCPDGEYDTNEGSKAHAACCNALGAIYCLSIDRCNIRDLAHHGALTLCASTSNWRAIPVDILQRQLAALAYICSDVPTSKTLEPLKLLQDLDAIAHADPLEEIRESSRSGEVTEEDLSLLNRCIVSIIYNIGKSILKTRETREDERNEAEEENDAKAGARSLMLNTLIHLVLCSAGEEEDDNEEDAEADIPLLRQSARALEEWSEDAQFAELMAAHPDLREVAGSLVRQDDNEIILCIAAALCNVTSTERGRGCKVPSSSWLQEPSGIVELVEQCFFRINEAVKCTFLQIFHNMMQTEGVLRSLIESGKLESFFKLTKNINRADNRETVSFILLSIVANEDYHAALLDAGLLPAILGLLTNESEELGPGADLLEEIPSSRSYQSSLLSSQGGPEGVEDGSSSSSSMGQVRQRLASVLVRLVSAAKNTRIMEHSLDFDQFFTAMELIGGECERKAMMILRPEDSHDSCAIHRDSSILLTWLMAMTKVSFFSTCRKLIVSHSEGRAFSRLKALCIRDPILGGTCSNPPFDPIYRCLAMAVIVNLSVESSLWDDLEGQLAVVREFITQRDSDTSPAQRETGNHLDLRHLMTSLLAFNLLRFPDFRPRLETSTAGAIATLLCSGCSKAYSASSGVNEDGATTSPYSEIVLYGGNDRAALVAAKFLAALCIHLGEGGSPQPHSISQQHQNQAQVELPPNALTALSLSVMSYSGRGEDVARYALMAICKIAAPKFENEFLAFIEAQVLEAIRCALFCPSLVGQEGPPVALLRACTVALRNLSTSFTSKILTPQMTSAVMDSVRQILALSDKAGWRDALTHCSVILLHLAEEAPTSVLETCNIGQILNQAIDWKSKEEEEGDSEDEETVRLKDIALYSLSRLCTRDRLPSGDGLVKVIDRMVDLKQDCLDSIDEFASEPVRPERLPLPPELTVSDWGCKEAPKSIVDEALTRLSPPGEIPLDTTLLPARVSFALRMQYQVVTTREGERTGGEEIRFSLQEGGKEGSDGALRTYLGIIPTSSANSVNGSIQEQIFGNHAAMQPPLPSRLAKFEARADAEEEENLGSQEHGAPPPTASTILRVHGEKLGSSADPTIEGGGEQQQQLQQQHVAPGVAAECDTEKTTPQLQQQLLEGQEESKGGVRVILESRQRRFPRNPPGAGPPRPWSPLR